MAWKSRRALVIGSVFLFFPFLAFAAPERGLIATFGSTISPWFDSNAQQGNLIGVGGLSIHYVALKGDSRVPAASCAIVFSPGQGDFAKEYAEFFFDLRDLGCDGYIIDHRGQGDSARLLKDPQKSHVNRFSDYVDDFSKFMDEILRPARYQSTVLIGESMGGTIAAGFLALHPKDVSQAILLGPMIQIATAPFSEWVAMVASEIAVFGGFGKDYVLGEGPEDPNEPFGRNTLTSSATRFAILKGLERQHPEWRVGGVTNRWLGEAIRYSRRIRKKTGLFRIPTLILQAENDAWVVGRGQAQACLGSPENCELVKVFGSRHDILYERDEIRDPVISLIRSRIALRDGSASSGAK